MSIETNYNGYPEKAVKKANERVIVELCIQTAAQAKRLAPVDKGRLRQSIGWRTEKQAEGSLESTPKNGQGYVGTNVEYGVYQEFGTRKMDARPFLRPAGAIVNRPGKIKEILETYASQEITQEIKRKHKQP
jgi:HK97 gp10 family phage protein